VDFNPLFALLLEMKLYNALVPVFKIIDKCLFNLIGISVIVEGIKE
jgi:hypothetical protein